MNTSKVLEYFNAQESVKGAIHIIGCGSIGSNVAEQLVRLGCTNIHLWDFDTVEAHNITNQNFTDYDIGKPKVEAVRDMMLQINPSLENAITLHPEGITTPWIVNGYIFLCVDNIDVRREIVNANKYNPNCLAFIDFRTRLIDAQHYFADRRNSDEVKRLLSTMDFTHAEAKAATPKSACGVELSVCYVIKIIVSFGMANFVKFCIGESYKNTIFVNMNFMSVDAFPEE